LKKDNFKRIECISCTNSLCLIKKNFFFDQNITLESQKQQSIHKKGNYVFQAGNPIRGLNIIQNGVIELFYPGMNGKMEVVRFAGNGHVFGHVGLENQIYPSNAIAKEDTLVCFFENNVLFEMYQSSPQFIFDLLSFFSKQHNKTVYRLIFNAKMNLREKVADALVYLYKNFGLNEMGELKECFSRDDIASLACTTTEQVSRQLSDFEKDKIIEKHSRRISILKPEKLKQITENFRINAIHF